LKKVNQILMIMLYLGCLKSSVISLKPWKAKRVLICLVLRLQMKTVKKAKSCKKNKNINYFMISSHFRSLILNHKTILLVHLPRSDQKPFNLRILMTQKINCLKNQVEFIFIPTNIVTMEIIPQELAIHYFVWCMMITQ